jgi:hypothetical protein
MPLPVVTSIGFDLEATAGQPVAFPFAASNHPTTFGVSGLPASGSLSINAAGVLSGTPLGRDGGTYQLLVTAYNQSGGGPALPVALHIAAPAGLTTPTIAFLFGNYQIVTGPFVLTAAVHDTNPNAAATVSYLLDGVPLGSGANPYTLTWSPSYTANGTHWLTANMTDSYGYTATTSLYVNGRGPQAVHAGRPVVRRGRHGPGRGLLCVLQRHRPDRVRLARR